MGEKLVVTDWTAAARTGWHRGPGSPALRVEVRDRVGAATATEQRVGHR